MSGRPSNGLRDRGAAILIAVATAGLMATIALGVSRESRTAVLVAANERRAAEARAAAEAGVARGALALARAASGLSVRLMQDERPATGAATALGFGGPPIPDGRPYTLVWGEARITLSIQDEAGKLDVNLAEPALLAALMDRLGLDNGAEVAAAMAAARAAGGAGRLSMRLTDRAFPSLSAFAGEVGLSGPAFARLRPYLSVASGGRSGDVLLAPEALYEVMPLDRATRTALAADRTDGRTDWRAVARRVTITAEAQLDDGTRGTASALYSVEPRRTPPLRRLRIGASEWSDPEAAPPAR